MRETGPIDRTPGTPGSDKKSLEETKLSYSVFLQWRGEGGKRKFKDKVIKQQEHGKIEATVEHCGPFGLFFF